MHEQRSIGEILIDLRVLTPAEVERVLDALGRRYDHQKFGQMARDMGLVREEHILAAMAVQMELFAGIHALTLRQILMKLQSADTPSQDNREPAGTRR